MKQTRVEAVALDADGIVADVAPTTRIARCSGCGCRVRSVYDGRERHWRHLDLGGMRLMLRYRLRRVQCRRCGVIVEMVPWAEPGSWFTYDFEDQVGYLAQKADKTSVVETMRIAWRTVGAIATRVVERYRSGDRLDGLTHIGIDELSYRRHHEYVTVVIDHVAERVVWVQPGKNADTLAKFFEELGPRCSQLEVVTMDMSKAYLKAVTKASPHAKIVFDRFHVQRLAHNALDEVRREEVREIDAPEDKRALKRTRFILQKNPWNLTAIESQRLSLLQRVNKPIYRAYLLKESLAAILDRRQPSVARDKLHGWIGWARRSRLKPFKKVAATIKEHLEGIVAYVETKLSNGRSEGLNGKIRTITRRSFGFHSSSSLIGLIFLCCSGISLLPVQKFPRSAH